jgi:hypothetical protein
MSAITKATIDAMIDKVQYYRFPGTCITMCCITLRNGYAVTGESSCADPRDFDVELGQQHSKRRAVDRIYELAAFQVRETAMVQSEFVIDGQRKYDAKITPVDSQSAGVCPETIPQGSKLLRIDG